MKLNETSFYAQLAEKMASELVEIYYERGLGKGMDIDDADQYADEKMGELLGVGPYVVADLLYGDYDAYGDYCENESEVER